MQKSESGSGPEFDRGEGLPALSGNLSLGHVQVGPNHEDLQRIDSADSSIHSGRTTHELARLVSLCLDCLHGVDVSRLRFGIVIRLLFIRLGALFQSSLRI